MRVTMTTPDTTPTAAADAPETAQASSALTPEVRSVLTVGGSVGARRGHGGTAPERVREQIAEAEASLADSREWAATALR